MDPCLELPHPSAETKRGPESYVNQWVFLSDEIRILYTHHLTTLSEKKPAYVWHWFCWRCCVRVIFVHWLMTHMHWWQKTQLLYSDWWIFWLIRITVHSVIYTVQSSSYITHSALCTNMYTVRFGSEKAKPWCVLETPDL